jgi:SulP family sulfate permease
MDRRQIRELLPHLFPFLEWWPLVNRRTLRADFLAGLTGAIIVIPQGVAFALIAGLPPVYGLYTAIVVPIVAALFGSSWHLISGPTTAISLVVFSAVSRLAAPGSPEFVELAITLTFLAGAFQLGLGVARLGILTNFVSHTVVVGFTAGAAVLVASSQLKYALGVSLPSSDNFLGVWLNIARHAGQTNIFALLTTLVTLAAALLARRFSRRSPHLLLGMIVGAIAAQLFGGVAAGIDFVEAVPARLPPPSRPELNLNTLRQLATNAFAIALLGLIEAVAIAKAIAMKSQQRFDSNQEFIGQGLSNVVGSFFSCFAGTGSFTRSGVNHDAGARTPMAAVFAAALLALFLLFLAPLATLLPLPAMAGVILLVAFNLINLRQISDIWRASNRETAVLLVTLLATLFSELEFAIYVGVFLSLAFYLERTARPNIAALAPDVGSANRRFVNVARKNLKECPQLKVIRIDGSLYYGAIDHVDKFLRALRLYHPQKRLLIVANGINFIDVSGAEYLVQEARRWKEKGGGLYFSGLKIVAQDVITNGGYRDTIGPEHFFPTKSAAIAAIFQDLEVEICQACTARIFLECAAVPPKREEEAE